MRQIVAFSLQRRPLVILLFFTFIVIGLVGFTKLNIEAYPDPVPPQVVIITQNPGQTAEEIERYVTIPVEVAMAGLPNLTSVRSTSLFGLSDVRVQFNFNYTYDQALQQVLNRLGQLDGLPDGRAAADLAAQPDRRDHALPAGRPARLFAGGPQDPAGLGAGPPLQAGAGRDRRHLLRRADQELQHRHRPAAAWRRTA